MVAAPGRCFGGWYRGRRVLVTGHTGFKGSWLARWLIELGAEVEGFSRDVPTRPSHYAAIGLARRLRGRRGDVRDLAALRRALSGFRPEIVFHLAAQPIVRAAYEDPKTTFDVNLGGTVNLLEALRDARTVRAAVLITSDKCYENREWDWGYRETDRLGGKDPYSASKACAELAASAYMRSFLLGSRVRAATARAGNVIGGGDWARDRLVPDCARAWAAGKRAVIRSPHATRPWQHVLEPLSGYLALGAGLGRGLPGLEGEAFNFGPAPEDNLSVAELLAAMRRTWKDCLWVRDPRAAAAPKEAGQLKLNCDKALRRLRWRPTLAAAEAVAWTASWYRDYYASGGRGAASATAAQLTAYARLARERGRGWAGVPAARA